MSVMTRLDDKEDITQHEISALKTRFNLADAHTHQDQSVTQREIVNRLPELWYRAQGQSQYQSEQEFIQAFFTFHGQEHALKRHDEIYLVYAASIAMHITATYLRKRNMRVGLIEPCFDNLHDLLKHMEVPLTPLDETLLQSPTNVYAKLQSAAANVDAIFLVDPNNPTGTSMFAKGADTFVEVARYCKDHGKLLILDFCFAAFSKQQEAVVLTPMPSWMTSVPSTSSWKTPEKPGRYRTPNARRSWPVGRLTLTSTAS